MTERIGSRFGPYEIVGLLGAGGMGEVYRARDSRLHRDVAIKILHRSALDDPERQRRFAQEAIAASALNHPNILVVYDVGIEANEPYIVSELIDGVPLREELQRGRMALKRLLEVAARIADGLAAAHAAGIVHRDLKPDNVMITRDGRVKIVDFGLAKPTGRAEDIRPTHPTQTAAGLLLGTVPYMSPEQAAGGTVDFRSDQFAFGLMAYEMATATHPFIRATPVQTLAAVMSDEPRPLAEAGPHLPTALRWIIERCLAKDPRARYANSADLAADLQQLRDRASELPQAVQLSRPSRRYAPYGWIVATVAAAAVGVLIGAASGGGQETLRYVPFANDAGYQGQPAWSPDGKSVAYVADVDGVLQVFTRSVTSVLRTQVTRVRFDCHEPFWSPDGARLYFHSLAADKDSLWSISPAGGPPTVVVEGAARAAIAPDNRALAVFREEEASSVGMRLWFASADGANLVRYSQPPLDTAVSDGVLRYAPDGSKLLVWFNGYGGAGPAQNTQFVIISDPAKSPRTVLESLAGPRAPPLFSWLSDNRRIVVVRNDGDSPGSHLWLADVETNQSAPLTVTNTNESFPAVAPDGRRLAFTSEATDFDLVMVPADGAPPRTFLSSTRNELDPAWSPTGAQYAFVTDRNGGQEIWVRSEEAASERGGFERPLVTAADFPGSRTMVLGSLAFSPDGRRLAYQRFADGGYRIWISTLAGGTPAPLSSDEAYQDGPTWSPDGAWVAYISGTKSARWSLVKNRVGAAAPELLHDDVAPFARPQWSPDGRWVLCQTSEGLLLIAAEGKTRRTLSRDNWFAYSWSDDGTRVFALRMTDDLHHFLLGSLSVATGAETILNPNLGIVPQANQPIRGFSRVRRDGFLTSIARVRSDIWLLEGFSARAGRLPRWWPFSREGAAGR